MPWLFAEPRYGIALLFIAFAALQYVGINARQAMDGNTGIYTSTESVADIGRAAAVSTNRIDYPKVPDNFQLFPQQQADSDVKFVGRLEEQE